MPTRDPNAKQLGVTELQRMDSESPVVRIHEHDWDWDSEIKRKVFQSKHKDQRDSVYREGKTAAHKTRGGKGLVARLMGK